jgi:hypothetical protein
MINLILILLLAFISASAMARVQDSDHTPAASSRETTRLQCYVLVTSKIRTGITYSIASYSYASCPPAKIIASYSCADCSGIVASGGTYRTSC